MSSSQFVTESLEQMLVSMADGLREAQESLNTIPAIDRFGRAMPSYQIPYMDFELQVDMEVTTNSAGLARMQVRRALNNQRNTSQSVSSNISGRFVAIPPGEGLPIPILNFSSKRLSKWRHSLQIQLTNTAGEVVPGAQVELNFELERSKELSIARSGTDKLKSIKHPTLARAVLITDATGYAETELTIDTKVPAGELLVVSAEYAQKKSQITVMAGNEK